MFTNGMRKIDETIHAVMITGVNAGLGKETARTLASYPFIQKIYLACRNETRAKEAKEDLEATTNNNATFEIVMMDVCNLASVQTAVNGLKEPIDGLIMNAGAMGGKNSGNLDEATGVTHMVLTNALGHVQLLEQSLEQEKLTATAIFSGSEAVRGTPTLGLWTPVLKTGSAAEFQSICNGA